MLKPGEIVIHKGNAHQFVTDPIIDGEKKTRGLQPRDWARHPCGSIPGIPVSTVKKIPRADWPKLIEDLVARKALLSDVRDTGMPDGTPIPSRDQNGKGYCWAHSTVSAAILGRAKDGQPYADLSAYAIACIIKNFRDEGGWNGESMDFLEKRGVPSSGFWPQQSMDKANDNPATWANAALHRMTEREDIPDRDFDTLFTHLLIGDPSAIDENWWSHSICATDPVNGATDAVRQTMRADSGKLYSLQEFDDIWEVDVGGGFGIRIWNSWGDKWSANGMGILTESKGTPDGAVALRVARASAA